MTIYLTHGAKKNVGDYLIHSRVRKLWEHVVPDVKTASIQRWEKVDLPEDATGLVLAGGPGLTTTMLERVFPIAVSGQEAGVPISGMALGWQGRPMHKPKTFTMTASSVQFLRETFTADNPISVRDEVSAELAGMMGAAATVTGCAAWYSIAHLGVAAPQTFAEPTCIIFTTPASADHTDESISAMKLVKRHYPNARVIAAFHRGIEVDEHTPKDQSKPLVRQAKAAKRLGFEVRDVAYGLEKIGHYQTEADLHIGYRVHAHLDFVSRRTPSILISEDGRGSGQSETLHGKGSVIWAGREQTGSSQLRV